MRHFFLALTMGAAMLIAGCTTGPLGGYAETMPKIAAEEYFNGPVKAWGIVQSMGGKVVQRFDVTMVGRWNGNVGTLDEEFTYYDGKKQTRTWTITKLADGRYEGTAGDIIGKATGATSGSAMQWGYVMDIPVDGKMVRVKLDDWMFLMNDGILINRSYIKKYGLTVAELTIVMKKGE